jgi:hypothetical protein
VLQPRCSNAAGTAGTLQECWWNRIERGGSGINALEGLSRAVLAVASLLVPATLVLCVLLVVEVISTDNSSHPLPEPQ